MNRSKIGIRILIVGLISIVTVLLIIPSFTASAEYTDYVYKDDYEGWVFNVGNNEYVYLSTYCEITFRHSYSEWSGIQTGNYENGFGLISSYENSEANGINRINRPPPIPWQYWTILKIRHNMWKWTPALGFVATAHVFTIDILSAGTQNYLWHHDTERGYNWQTFYPNVGEIAGPSAVDVRWFFDWETAYSHKFTVKYHGGTLSWTRNYGYVW
ncbi:MAG: hypothetical protein ACW98I_21050 [Candidatus Hodarchaeales archaeon]